ncbi:MAG: methyltransferase, TIGR04325 family [Oligoflexia bacterium]
MKRVIKQICPPFIWSAVSRLKPRLKWEGCYSSYAEALKAAGGSYSDPKILEKVANATRQVRDGRALFERDSVIFEHPEYSWPLLASVFAAAASRQAQSNALQVVDLGGALGTHYFQLRPFLKGIFAKWQVVEQEPFAVLGQREFSDNCLSFTNSAATSVREPDILICASVLQYLPDPESVLAECLSKRPRYVFVERTPLVERGGDFWTVQNVPSSIYSARYPCRVFSRQALQTLLGLSREGYTLIAELPTLQLSGDRILSGGFWFEAKEGSNGRKNS